jgi:hypothetical protein
VVQLPMRRLDGMLVSCWRLAIGEIEEIIRTGLVWLSVWARET